MRVRAFALLALCPMLAAVLAGGCGSCGRQDSIAKLAETTGEVSRDVAATPREWRSAGVGDEFATGDAVKTGAGGQATVEFTAGGGLLLAENTVVRFLPNQEGDTRQRLALELGQAELRAGEGGIRIGNAIVLGGGVLRVTSVEGGSTSLEVLVGRATVEGEGGLTVDLGEGEILTIDVGGAIIEETPDAGPDAEPDAEPDADDGGDAGTGDAEVAVGGEGDVSVSVEGRGVTAQAPGGSEWTALEAGTTTMAASTRVRLPARTQITVTRGDEHATVIGAAEAIVGVPGGALVDLARGRTTADATSTDVLIRVPGGTITVRAAPGEGSRGEVIANGPSTQVMARRGQLSVQGSGPRELLRAGESSVLERGGTVSVLGRAPARAHLLITAGESPTIHDPNPPVAVGVRFAGLCPGRGVVEVARRGSFEVLSFQSFGEGSANFLANSGSHRYRVRCAAGDTPEEEVKAEGTVRVQRDSGRAQLPRRPSRNVVDTDGRPYTLLYQNLLPIITVRWPRAPRANSYVLHIQPQSGAERTYPDARPQHTFETGEVGEGTSRVWFTAAGATPGQSPTTTMRLGFDNAAPTAQLTEPAPGAAIGGGTVTVAGIALDGWTVSVGGTDLPLDPSFRFRGDVPVPSDVDAIAIRIANPRRGTHYYVRKVRGGAN